MAINQYYVKLCCFTTASNHGRLFWVILNSAPDTSLKNKKGKFYIEDYILYTF